MGSETGAVRHSAVDCRRFLLLAWGIPFWPRRPTTTPLQHRSHPRVIRRRSLTAVAVAAAVDIARVGIPIRTVGVGEVGRSLLEAVIDPAVPIIGVAATTPVTTIRGRAPVRVVVRTFRSRGAVKKGEWWWCLAAALPCPLLPRRVVVLLRVLVVGEGVVRPPRWASLASSTRPMPKARAPPPPPPPPPLPTPFLFFPPRLGRVGEAVGTTLWGWCGAAPAVSPIATSALGIIPPPRHRRFLCPRPLSRATMDGPVLAAGAEGGCRWTGAEVHRAAGVPHPGPSPTMPFRHRRRFPLRPIPTTLFIPSTPPPHRPPQGRVVARMPLERG